MLRAPSPGRWAWWSACARRGGRRPPARGIPATARRLIVLAALVVVVLVGFEAVHRVLPDSSKPTADPHGQLIRVVIPRGADASAIGRILEQRGVVADGS